ncbi:MAG: hypothetical protein AB7O67_03490 [Vicinamibacterales bacterium]
MKALLFVAMIGGAALGAGCATTQARTEVAMPELSPPPPPPRVVADYDQPAPAEPMASPAEAATPVTPQPAGQPRREAPPARTEPAPASSTPTPPRPATTPSLTLTPAPGTEAQTAASIRALVARADRDLGRVNYAGLDADRRTQYDTARRFVQQAEAALKEGNLVFAGKLADKAVTMAAVLVR